tara:strand:- start:383 stop:802 length:420 start_codon:yes stop_codon:yes gene_type:complete
MNKLYDILSKVRSQAENELGYLVDPESSSPIDWPKYPVMLIDSVGEASDDTKIVDTLEHTLAMSVAILVKDNSRNERIKKVTQVVSDFKQFIYRNEQWGCLAVDSSYDSSETVWTTDTDNLGAAIVKFFVTYRERIVNL